jgi:hypothetical protein
MPIVQRQRVPDSQHSGWLYVDFQCLDNPCLGWEADGLDRRFGSPDERDCAEAGRQRTGDLRIGGS